MPNTDFSQINIATADFSQQILLPLESDRYEYVSSAIGSVDLRLVIGANHPDYYGKSWGDLLPRNYADFMSSLNDVLKRSYRNMKVLQDNPDYYLDKATKSNWTFYEIDGSFYVKEGAHRTIIGRWFFFLNGLDPIVYGVSISKYVKRQYFPVSRVLHDEPLLPEPQSLDHIALQYRGVKVDVYGVLHAITGGTNREYVDLVNKSITTAKGVIYSEKEMKLMYKGIHHEVDDWLQVPLKDMFFMTFWLGVFPTRLVDIVYSAIKEKLTQHDRFKTARSRSIENIGGSAFFHLIAPNERRELAGFSNPAEYLHVNLSRRSGSHHATPEFPDRDWRWLEYIEPYANIPCRSVHMVEFAVEHAIQTKQEHISLFVGEIHNTDIEWYTVNNSNILVDERFKSALPPIISLARSHATDVATGQYGLKSKRAWFHVVQRLALLSGMLIPVLVWYYILHNFI
jgi:hypothetical protein